MCGCTVHTLQLQLKKYKVQLESVRTNNIINPEFYVINKV